MPHTPESSENIHNLGMRKKNENEPWVATDEIPASVNYEPALSPDEEAMKREEESIRSKIAQLRQEIASLGKDDGMRVIKEKRIEELKQQLGDSEDEDEIEELAA